MSAWIRVANCGHYVPGRPTLTPVKACKRCALIPAAAPLVEAVAPAAMQQTEPAQTTVELITETPQPPVICTSGLMLKSCVRCGRSLPPSRPRGRRRTQCRQCPKVVRPPRPAAEVRPSAPTNCKTCGGEIEKPRRNKRYCRPRCAAKGNPRRCEVKDCPRPHLAKGLCRHHYGERYYPDSRWQWPTDPEAKRKRDLIRAKRRRAAERTAEAENVDRDVVGERDGWRCGVCRRKVDRRKKWPHPLSPSLDHVIPRSHHGPHTYANTRITHLRCNMSRSNRGGNEQLALVG